MGHWQNESEVEKSWLLQSTAGLFKIKRFSRKSLWKNSSAQHTDNAIVACNNVLWKSNKPGPAQVGAISKAQK